MKLIYQQMIGMLTTIIVSLLVVAALFIHSTTTAAWEDNFRQLSSYTSNLEQNALLNKSTINSEFIQSSERILSGQHVNFVIYNSKNQMRYPGVAGGSIQSKYWQQLKSGDSVAVKAATTNPRNGKTQNITIFYRPVFYSGKLLYVIAAYEPVEAIQTTISKTKRSVLIGFIISATVAVILSYFIARYTNRRIDRLRNATHEVAQGNYDVELETTGRDEISELASDFSNMTDSLKASEKEIERQEDRRRQFMADAAHEMRTPLTTINGLLEGLAYDAIPEESKAKSIELMQNETKRLIRIVNENLDYEKIRTNQIILQRQTFKAKRDIDNVTLQLHQKAESAGDELIVDVPEDLMVYADHDRFVQIIFNIVQNAIQFTQNGHVRITGQRGYQQAEFSISDDGIGMSADQVQNIWERYYKADPSRKNTKYGESGLGLAIVHQLVAQHGGTIDVQSELGAGTTFHITFPDEQETNDAQPADA
ncbi:sensor histidine kinase [Lacticaseibacillus pantheris]|uniref:histidine kinase n=1 Tax=Lacticaseibacillus pantheris DSM 15945 = JCM 12539 = NBRC 106106 TaxID=1423783 RepID=A0A0R1TZ83_9LACO|nr:HAMP domain-containing sensor histidine kinase [Lacticaseibacillus pantheris]KRL86544.1 two component sensor transduction histidine kinase [Lacticaseibacillus pantheris DSM 15945 = JCM 12539 = NBRC 106106]WKF84803.1 HAMP domain-containing sensor histidine kinase [Lacticaseibacillus pantheris]